MSFETLAVEDKESMWRLVRLVDKVGGWVFVHAGQDDEDDEGEDVMPDDLKRAFDVDYHDGRKVSGDDGTTYTPGIYALTYSFPPAINIGGISPFTLYNTRQRHATWLGISSRCARTICGFV